MISCETNSVKYLRKGKNNNHIIACFRKTGPVNGSKIKTPSVNFKPTMYTETFGIRGGPIQNSLGIPCVTGILHRGLLGGPKSGLHYALRGNLSDSVMTKIPVCMYCTRRNIF